MTPNLDKIREQACTLLGQGGWPKISTPNLLEVHWPTTTLDARRPDSITGGDAQDQQSLLPYAYNGNVMTIDPVSTGNPGWKEFLAAYNQFCGDRNGCPLLNQTFGVTPEIARKALGTRLTEFAETRRIYDPGNRLLNDYFRGILP